MNDYISNPKPQTLDCFGDGTVVNIFFNGGAVTGGRHRQFSDLEQLIVQTELSNAYQAILLLTR